MKKIILTAICLSLGFASLQAQQKEVVNFFQDYIKEINALDHNSSIENVIRFFRSDYTANQTEIDVRGNISHFTEDLSDIRISLQSFVDNDQLELKLTYEKLSGIATNRNTAIISALIKLQIKLEGELIETDLFAVSMIAVRQPDNGWKFVRSNGIRTIKEKKAGTCICNYYEREGAYATELFVPNGINYRAVLEAIRIEKSEIGTRTIRVAEREYDWEQDGSLYNKLSDKESLGNATNDKEAINLILKELYKERCLTIITG